MPKLFAENLAIVDEKWIIAMIQAALQPINKEFVCLGSKTAIRRAMERFEDAERVIIHWEGYTRRGGAIVEELMESTPLFDVKNQVIILTTEPNREDVYYFHELGLARVIKVSQTKKGQQAAREELASHFLKPISKGTPLKDAWLKVQNLLDDLGPNSEFERVTAIEKAIAKLSQKSKGKLSATYYDAMGTISYARGNATKAEQFWMKALELNPNFYRTYQNLIKFYDTEKKYDQSLSLMHKLNKLNRNNISRLTDIGETHKKMENNTKAEHYFNLVLDQDENHTRALNGLAEIRFDQGLFEDARKLLQKSDNPEATASNLNRKGIELVRAKRFQEALELYQNAQYVLPNQEKGPMLLYNIGLCYSRWGKFKLAREYLKLALIKKPDYEKAKTLLNRLDVNPARSRSS